MHLARSSTMNGMFRIAISTWRPAKKWAITAERFLFGKKDAEKAKLKADNLLVQQLGYERVLLLYYCCSFYYYSWNRHCRKLVAAIQIVFGTSSSFSSRNGDEMWNTEPSVLDERRVWCWVRLEFKSEIISNS
jgi:hypothetical protein